MPHGERDALLRWLQGNEHAADLMQSLFAVSQVLDDLADGDTPTTPASRAGMAADAVAGLLVGVGNNPFYRAHENDLRPLCLDAVLAWQLSAELETGDTTDRCWAFVCRDSLERVLVGAARIIGGLAWAGHVQRAAYRYFRRDHADGQSLPAWLDELRNEQ